MSLVERAQQLRALEVKQRLRNPVNAVMDFPIDLRRKMAPKEQPIPSPPTAPAPAAAELVPCMNVRVVYAPFGYLSRDGDPSIELIQRVVCKHYGISMGELKSSRRTAHLIGPRHAAFYLAKKLTNKSLPYIGRRFGGRDHTTVLYAVDKLEKLRQADSFLDAELTLLSETITAQAQANQSLTVVNPPQ